MMYQATMKNDFSSEDILEFSYWSLQHMFNADYIRAATKTKHVLHCKLHLQLILQF